MRRIDADALLKDFAERARAARNWKENAINKGDEEIMIRADATLAFLTEVKLTIENAPTIEETTGEPNCDICEDKAKQYSLGFQDGYITGKERPQGEWIRDEKTFEDLSGAFETYTRSTCSVCNQANGWGEVPYCPWCGTKMERRHDGHGETDQKQEG